MKVDVNVFIALVSVAIVIATFFIGRNSSAKQQGTNEGVIATEIKHLRDDVNELKGMMANNANHLTGRVDELSRQYSEAIAMATAASKSAEETCKRLLEHLEDHKCNRL